MDSSAWIEFLADGPKAVELARYFEHEERMLVPAIVFYEVYKKLLREQGHGSAERFLSQALRLPTADLDPSLAVAAAHAGLEHGLAMADAIIYAVARVHEARLVILERHFQKLPGVIHL